jgi:5-methylcytosine-specific restriction endonuclease McrA
MCSGPFEHVDHVKPIAKGGLNVLSNMRPACGSCNSAKRAKWFGVAELHRFSK